MNIKVNEAKILDPAEEFTPQFHIKVKNNGYKTNLSVIDNKFIAVLSCMGYQKKDVPDFIIDIASNEDYFPCKTDNSYCWGETFPMNHIYITQDLHSLSHELVHMMRQNVVHDEVVSFCGNRIDDMFSSLGFHKGRYNRRAGPKVSDKKGVNSQLSMNKR